MLMLRWTYRDIPRQGRMVVCDGKYHSSNQGEMPMRSVSLTLTVRGYVGILCQYEAFRGFKNGVGCHMSRTQHADVL